MHRSDDGRARARATSDRLVFHTFDAEGSEAWREGERRLREVRGTGVEALIDGVRDALRVGVSDGN